MNQKISYLLKSLISLLITNIICQNSEKVYYSFNSDEEFYGLSLKNQPGERYRYFIDTYNEYIILYDPPNEMEWPKDIIKYLEEKQNDEYTTIYNYDIPIKVKEFSSNIELSNDIEIETLNFYYTNKKCQDNNVWENIPSNIRQLSLGLGLGVANENYSLIHSLFNQEKISNKCFNFEHINGNIYINFGHLPEIAKFEWNSTISIPSKVNKWGLQINSLMINGQIYRINQYAYINSGIDTSIQSKYIYTIMKQHLDENSYFNDNCKETIGNVIECATLENLTNFNLTFNFGDNIGFNISLHSLFKTIEQQKIFTITYKEEDQSIHLGKSFLELFNLIEFNFDSRSITLYSNTIPFFNWNLKVPYYLIYLFWSFDLFYGIYSIVLFIFYYVDLKNKMVNFNELL